MTGADIVYVEDAFLRSLHPGRDKGEPPLGLFIDTKAPHFDPTRPSDLETLLATHPLDDSALLARARGGIERLKEAHLSKYAANDPSLPPPEPGYVLVIDQTRGDASVTASGAGDAEFREMLVMAQEEHPGCRVLIKTHPETVQGHRKGYFGASDETNRVKVCTEPIHPGRSLKALLAFIRCRRKWGSRRSLPGTSPGSLANPLCRLGADR